MLVHPDSTGKVELIPTCQHLVGLELVFMLFEYPTVPVLGFDLELQEEADVTLD